MEKGLFDLESTFRDRAANGSGGGGILLQGEKGFTNGDLDFAFVPRHHLMITADEADGDTVRFAGNIELGGALKQEALGDIVSVIIDESFFDEHVKIVKGDADRAALEGFLGEMRGNFAGNVGDKTLVFLVKNICFALGLEQVGQGTTNGIGDLA